MNIELLNQYISEGYITKTKHPVHNIWIYNYTNKTQYERFWNEITLNCRGLVLDSNHEVVSSAWKKFFNLEEISEIPNEEYEITKKMDGSLILFFYYKDEWITATKASFTSEQAIKAKEFVSYFPKKWLDYYSGLGFTFLFEIIWKENRICVDYGDKSGLILLDMVNKHISEIYSHNDLQVLGKHLNVEVSQCVYNITDFKKLQSEIPDNEEGYVIRFLPSNFRMKIKGEEYCRLHRILTVVSSRNIWEYLSEGRDFNEIIDRVPDEFYNWVKSVVDELEHKHHVILSTAINDFENIRYGSINKRAQFAEKAKETTYPHLVFRLYDGKNIEKEIWKMIYPKHELPFKKNHDN